jgi:hypothetical protein
VGGAVPPTAAVTTDRIRWGWCEPNGGHQCAGDHACTTQRRRGDDARPPVSCRGGSTPRGEPRCPASAH